MKVRFDGIESDLVSMRVAHSLTGPWVAELTADTDDVPENKQVDVLDDDGSTLLSGRVIRAASPLGRVEMRIQGGIGALGGTIEPVFIRDVSIEDVVATIASSVGFEYVFEGSDVALEAWLIRRGTAASALDALVETVGGNWRTLPDGRLWFGVDVFAEPADPEEPQLSRTDAAHGLTELTFDTYPSEWLPGRLLYGVRVQSVVTTVGQEGFVARVYSGDTDRLRAAVDQRAREAVARRWSFAFYEGELVSQDGDVIDVQLDPDLSESDRLLPLLTRVPLRGVPHGARITLAAGARVLVGFGGGDPAKPYALPWAPVDSAQPELIDLKADELRLSGGGAAATPVAKEGSGTTGHTHGVSPTAGAWIAGVDAFVRAAVPALPVAPASLVNAATDTIASGQGSQKVKVP